MRTKLARADTPNADTRARILAVAREAFAERGFDGVSVRDVTASAGANLAAISYYFGSKEALIAEVFRSVVTPLNEQRLAALRSAIAEAAPNPPDLTAVVRAFIAPIVDSVRSSKATAGTYHRFHILGYALRRPFVDEMMSEESDRVALAFIDALQRAVPEVPRPELCWRFDFMVGSLVHILLDADRSNRLQRLSGGLCNTSDGASIVDQLTRFLVAGFRG